MSSPARSPTRLPHLQGGSTRRHTSLRGRSPVPSQTVDPPYELDYVPPIPRTPFQRGRERNGEVANTPAASHGEWPSPAPLLDGSTLAGSPRSRSPSPLFTTANDNPAARDVATSVEPTDPVTPVTPMTPLFGRMQIPFVELRAMMNQVTEAQRNNEFPSTRVTLLDPEGIVECHRHLSHLRAIRGDPGLPATAQYIVMRVEMARLAHERNERFREDDHRAAARNRIDTYLRSLTHEQEFYNQARGMYPPETGTTTREGPSTATAAGMGADQRAGATMGDERRPEDIRAEEEQAMFLERVIDTVDTCALELVNQVNFHMRQTEVNTQQTAQYIEDFHRDLQFFVRTLRERAESTHDVGAAIEGTLHFVNTNVQFAIRNVPSMIRAAINECMGGRRVPIELDRLLDIERRAEEMDVQLRNLASLIQRSEEPDADNVEIQREFRENMADLNVRFPVPVPSPPPGTPDIEVMTPPVEVRAPPVEVRAPPVEVGTPPVEVRAPQGQGERPRRLHSRGGTREWFSRAVRNFGNFRGNRRT